MTLLASLRRFACLAESSGDRQLTIEDLPDDVLERVFVLAGQQYYPAIVGVSKRWWRLCWGSKALWRRLDISDEVPEALVATSARTWWPFFFRTKEGTWEIWEKRWRLRRKSWQEAQRPRLERIGDLTEAVSISGQLFSPPSGLLLLLSPESLMELSLVDCRLELEGWFTLAGFTRLTSLVIAAEHDCPHVAPMLPRLARLQRLDLRANRTSVQLAHLLPLTGLTSLSLKVDDTCFRSPSDLTSLQQLRYLRLDVCRSDFVPAPASFGSLESYCFWGRGCEMQLAGFSFWLLTFGTLEGKGIAGLSHPLCAPFKGKPSSLTIAGLGPVGNAPADDGGGAQLNALLEAALPPSGTLRQLNLCGCCLEAAFLQHLPVLARLGSLTLEDCFSPGGLDAPLQALVQQAPALTKLFFLADAVPSASRCLGSWPAYLLAHPSLRSIRLWNREAAVWDEHEALSLDIGATQPVLELLATDCLTCVPPQLEAVTSLRSLSIVGCPEFQLTADACDTLLALPHLIQLHVPQRIDWKAVWRLLRARPKLSIYRCTLAYGAAEVGCDFSL